MSDTDLQLLARYTHDRAEDAFAELVRRHINLVHSAALRQVRSPQLAEEISQSVFTDLARNATKLKPDTILTAWLYQVTRRTAIDVVRHEARRQLREQIATEMNTMNATATDWTHIEPLLDEAMHALDDTDRAAVLLRYFENKTLREVGATLGTSDDAAQKRVSRAVERLREFFAKRGVTVGASGLVVVLSANAVQAAPVGLAISISTAALAGSTFTTAVATTTAIKILAMTTLQKALISGVILVFLGAAIFEAYHANQTSNERGRPSAAGESDGKQSEEAARPNSVAAAPTSRTQAKSTKLLAKAIADLQTALHAPPPPRSATRSYPSYEVSSAILGFGTDRKEAFAILKEAANDPDLEVRKRAIAAMGMVGKAATTFPVPEAEKYLTKYLGDPAPEAKSFLWKILQENPDGELASLAQFSLQVIGYEANDIPVLAEMLSHTVNDQLRRYLPEALAKTIQRDPAAAAPFISAVENLLNNPNSEVQFEAACALARYEAATHPQILDRLVSGLKSANSLQPLMALETLQNVGPAAEPALQAILDYADSTPDSVMKDIAFKTLGKIRKDLRSTFPEVEQALTRDLKQQEDIANWNQKLDSGNYSYQDLIDALKQPGIAAAAAKHLPEMGASARDAIPGLLAALAGQDQKSREQIVAAIHQIDPAVTVTKVSNETITTATLAALITSEGKADLKQRGQLIDLLAKDQMMVSEWRTQPELLELAKQIAASDQDVYRAFVAKLIETDPALKDLFKPLSNK